MTNNEEFIINCYKNCEGYNTNCSRYQEQIDLEIPGICYVKEIIYNDIKKLKKKDLNITFGVLEKIIENEN